MAFGKTSEIFQWLFTFANTAKDVVDWAMRGYEKIPDSFKQKLPGFLGLSLADEQIFNGVLCQLDAKKQVVIMQFLHKCKDYERNRFINIVAGMEVEKGQPFEVEKKWNNTAKKFDEKTKTGSQSKDRRLDFLNKFADVITDEFSGDFQKAYDFCIGGRMIISDPMHQKVLRSFSDSVNWFKETLLSPLGAISFEEAFQKARQYHSNNSNYWKQRGADARARYQAKVAARKSR